MLIPVLICICTPTAIWLALSMALAWENRRFAFVRLGQAPRIRNREHRTAVFLPCKGDDGDLQQNIEAFFQQRHPNFQLNLIVESKVDPALNVIERVRQNFPAIDSNIVVAGVATSDGQKVHNLRVATENIDPDVKVLAFADADIRPDPTWLQALTLTVCKNKKTAANTGYRWMLPEKTSLINLLVYSINATIAGTMGSGRHFLIWGGSWAIRRNNFDRLAIRDAWQGTLSDDLVASQVIHGRNENVRFAPRCICKTEFNMTLSGALEFLRRQYLIGRKYAGRMFWSSYLVLGTTVIAWWALFVVAFTGSGSVATFAAIGAATIYGMNVVKACLRQSVVRRKDAVTHSQHKLAALFDIFASPLVMTFNLSVMTWSLFGSRIWWRENRYHIHSNGQIEKLNQSGNVSAESPQDESKDEPKHDPIPTPEKKAA